ncbi:hypothetical protein DEU56DRAFT_906450 [Suillus clintonianus]|uniref:uncharacterized protein n=1 Tax=Suillus clintonianus TaxID=1904413 RepID=UPI001B85C147|nr:uncharacterized protein DEU56DRAFT_906450 [Suillus clintonianus]KAG2156287.1 hypothetical protein DEU56DRAFT_906450 [Suillus clintonianus]
MVRKAEKKELRKQRHIVRNNLQCFEDVQSSAAVDTTAIWAPDNDINMQRSSPQQLPPIDHDVALSDSHNAGPDFDDADHGPNEPAQELDDIRVEYHPHSQLPSTTHRLSEFSRSCPTEDYVPHNNSPWEPFRTQLDFEIALEAAMTKDQTN